MAGYVTPGWTNDASPAIDADALNALGEAVELGEHPYGVCSTAAATAAKTVTIDFSGTLTLFAGLTVRVKFTNANTAANPTLNVNGTGDVPIMAYGTSTTVPGSWAAGDIVEFVYDGTNFITSDCYPVAVMTSAQYAALDATDKAKDILYVITDDETPAVFQPLITANGVLQGDGAGGITARAVDVTPTANSTNLITSGGVKSALNSKANADSIAIVADGNTHIAITAGQYVYVKNHSTLAEGLYKSESNISANATLSNSNLTSISGGGLNQFLLLTSENPLDGRILAPKGLTLSEFCGLYDKTDANGIISFSLSSANSQALSGYGGTGFGFAKRIDSTGSTLLYFVLFQPAAHRISFGSINVSTQEVTLYGTYDFTT